MKRRIAMIGLGMAVTPHAKGLVDLADRVEVVWAASRSQARCDAFAAKFRFPTTTDIDRIFGDPTIDAVAIVTPPDSHLELVRRAAMTGKHVLLEKPLEIDTARARALIEVVRAAGIKIGVVLQSRFRDSAQALGRLIRDGALGEVAAATVSVPWWRPQSYYDEPGRGTLARDGGGVLMTQAIHPLDLFQSLVGIRSVSAVSATTKVHEMECEDFVAAGLVLANGAPGGLTATTAHYPGRTETIEIIGTLGTATLTGEILDIYYHDGRHERIGEATEGGPGGADPMAFSHAGHRAVMANFLDAIDEDRAPLVTAEEALRVHVLIDALLASAAAGKQVEVSA